jgi:hypothetical protein
MILSGARGSIHRVVQGVLLAAAPGCLCAPGFLH